MVGGVIRCKALAEGPNVIFRGFGSLENLGGTHSVRRVQDIYE